MSEKLLTARDKLRGKWVVLIGLVLVIGITLLSDLSYIGFVMYDFSENEWVYEFYLPAAMDLLYIAAELLAPLVLLIYVAGAHKLRFGTVVLSLTYMAQAFYYGWNVLNNIPQVLQFDEAYVLPALLSEVWDAGLMLVLLAAALLLLVHPTIGKAAAIGCTVIAMLMHFVTIVAYLIPCFGNEYIESSSLLTLLFFGGLFLMYGLLLTLLLFNRLPKLFSKAAVEFDKAPSVPTAQGPEGAFEAEQLQEPDDSE